MSVSAGRRGRYYRVLRVARTIHDLAGNTMPNAGQITGAIQYQRVFNGGERKKIVVKT